MEKYGNKTINVSIDGARITIRYSPKVYVQRGKSKGSKAQPVSDEAYEACLAKVIPGFQLWAGDYRLRDLGDVTVDVVVRPTRVLTARKANLIITVDRERPSMVPIAFLSILWSPKIKPRVRLNVGGFYGLDDHTATLAAHEFGHVLGLFDAYGYREHWVRFGLGRVADRLLPAARGERTESSGVMRCAWGQSPVISAREIEMMLRAFRTGRVQFYENCVLGRASRVFL